MRKNGKVFLISLGCAKNLVDSEHMLGILDSQGFGLASRIEDAEFALINTCGFLQSAVEEAIETILETARLKDEGKLKRLVVAGCFVQRYGYKLVKEIPEVDGWLGTGEIRRVADILLNDNENAPVPFLIGKPTFLADHHLPKVQSTPFYTAYLRIAEGCSHRCTYCLIPGLRGPFRSRRLKSLIEEAEEMAERGVKEINLIAQDTSQYGNDLYGETRLEDLLEGLIDINGIRWVRPLYVHPNNVSERFLDLIDSQETICPYLDLPFQHVNQTLLKSMGREPGQETPGELIVRIRNRKRGVSIRTTLMVGFPGETDEMFDQLCAFVKMAEFDHLGVFAFSPEKGTAAAGLRPAVDRDVAENRLAEIMTLQAGISKKINQRKIGSLLPVLIEGSSPETDLLLAGRTATMAPDVDTKVLINEGEGIVGEIMPVEITEAHTYDLVGKILGPDLK
ncbi:MAG: 30S ribosomal protein S12 methylthiotransferase RimO [Desulfobacteraceae bacterium]|uniref:Ribosomal protein uS12 methylthiotransferase RimO n=1 Tax=Candidatus Desulfacyla euxinica TaxID=2841693 RepID=A0A8J6T8W9_9DELT|nr:30S ribosomal protein S12 methylthiotransferase RimO [Candidatus Desulfacyla euxinica]MBL6978961.1 30S ribosomal protein S12 methylthiotransferase RimO [Desulfobacteraceae bacterium]